MTELPFPEESFDIVTSVFGTIFGDPNQVVGEMARVLFPSGRIAITSWTREGPMEQLRELTLRYVAEVVDSADPIDLPAGEKPSADGNGPESFDWGDPDQLRELFADHGIAVHCEKHRIPFVTPSPEAQNDEWFDHHPMWLATKGLIGEDAYDELRAESLKLLHEINEDVSAMRFTSSWLLTTGSPV